MIFATSYDAGGGAASPAGGGTWARIGSSQTDGNSQVSTWFWALCTSSVTSITGTPTLADANVFVEFSGNAAASPLDTQNTAKAAFSSTTTTDAATSNNITPAASGELILSAIYDSQGTAPTFTAGTGFTLAKAEPGTNGVTGAVAVEWKTGASGSQNATWTINKTGDTITVQIAAFKAAVVAASLVYRQTRRNFAGLIVR